MNLSAASALTHLEIVNADATSNCECCNFVSSLVKLRMISSYLSGLHAGGVTACSALQELHLYGSCEIKADTPGDKIYYNTMDFDTAMPLDFPCLTHLTDVKLYFWESDKLDVTGICALPALQSLELVLVQRAVGACTVPPAIVNLSQLSDLSIFQNGGDDLGIELLIEWRALQALQQLRLGGDFMVDSAILGLAEVKCLKHVHLLEMHIVNEDGHDVPAIDLGDLLDHLAFHRPDICVGTSKATYLGRTCTCAACRYLEASLAMVRGATSSSTYSLEDLVKFTLLSNTDI